MLKKILQKLSGKPSDWAAQALSRYPFIEPHENYHLQRVSHDLLAKTGGEVFSGPLAGMKIPLNSPLSNSPMHVIGCYEAEIHDVVADIICCPPPLIIDIGSAFGYYTVGLAYKTADSRIIGFEADKEFHWENARQLAEINGVENRIEQRGFCDSKALEEIAVAGTFVLCDCEGGEMQLLDPDKIPALKKCHILCEVHEFLAPNVTAKLVRRFQKTHNIKMLFEQERKPEKYRILDGLSNSYKEIAIKETRFSGKRLVSALFMEFQPK
jgi:hypothetical protein